jgi:hypothetical protein
MSNINQRLSRLDAIAARLPKKHYRPFERSTDQQLWKLTALYEDRDAEFDTLMDGVRQPSGTPDKPNYNIELLQQRLDAINTKEVQG